jgi:hypothetical protein
MVITYTENLLSPFHRDIHISLPELNIENYVDSYYFALDSGILPEEENDEKVKIVLRNLLTDWLLALDDLNDGYITHLPFDFSDEYVGALEIVRKGAMVTMRYCSMRAAGGAYPSFMSKFQYDTGTTVSTESITIPIMQLISDIKREQERINV